MRTRRSWRNQDRLYKSIGRDLARAAAASAAADTESQPALPGDVGTVRDVERAAPALAEVEFTLSAPMGAANSKQSSLF